MRLTRPGERYCAGSFAEDAASLHRGDGGVRFRPPLGSPDFGAGPYGAADRTRQGQALRSARQEERRQRRCRHCRGLDAAAHGIRADQERRAASRPDAASDTRSAGAPAHHAGHAIRAHLAEFGIVAAQGRRKVKELITGLDNTEVPELARLALWQIADQIDECDKHIDVLERRILAWHKSDEASCNLATIPGIGPITASAIAATVPDPSAFRNGRQLAAWLGLVPRQHSSGGKDRLSGIT